MPATVATYYNYIRRFVIRSAISRGWLTEDDFVLSYENHRRSTTAKHAYTKNILDRAKPIGACCVCDRPAYAGTARGLKTGNAKMLCPDCYAKGMSWNGQRRAISGNAKRVGRLVELVPLTVAGSIIGASVEEVRAIMIGKRKATDAQADAATDAVKKINNRTIDPRIVYPDDHGYSVQEPWAIRDTMMP